MALAAMLQPTDEKVAVRAIHRASRSETLNRAKTVNGICSCYRATGS
jgi:hypothetical protein